MFTGIVQGVARVESIQARAGLHTLALKLPAGFDAALAIGASVACDGVCLTVTERPSPPGSGVGGTASGRLGEGGVGGGSCAHASRAVSTSAL